jgi:hypothetical protein
MSRVHLQVHMSKKCNPLSHSAWHLSLLVHCFMPTVVLSGDENPMNSRPYTTALHNQILLVTFWFVSCIGSLPHRTASTSPAPVHKVSQFIVHFWTARALLRLTYCMILAMMRSTSCENYQVYFVIGHITPTSDVPHHNMENSLKPCMYSQVKTWQNHKQLLSSRCFC